MILDNLSLVEMTVDEMSVHQMTSDSLDVGFGYIPYPEPRIKWGEKKFHFAKPIF